MAMLQPKVEPVQEQNKKTVRSFGIRDKVGYLLGDLGNDFTFVLVSAFLMVFYTDVFHISAATVGTLFLVARLWDAFADVAWGRFIDTRKPSKNGKFSPWIFRMSFPLVISAVLMFVHIPGMSNGFYMAWAFVTYIVWGTLYSTVNIPYGSMASVITADPIERTSLSAWRTAGGKLGIMLVQAVGPLIVFVDNEISANRMLMAAILFSFLALASYIGCVKLSTERISAPVGSSNQPKPNLLKSMKGLAKNRPLISILAVSLIIMMNAMLVGAVNIYLFKNYFQNAAAISMVSLIGTAAIFVALAFINPLVKKFGKKEIGVVGIGLLGLSFVSLYFVPNITVTTYLVVYAIGQLGNGLFSSVLWAYVTDCVDYHEYATGLREDATVYSIYSMARKVGQAVAGGIGGFAIAAVGYNATLKVQTQATLDGILALGTIVPGIVYIVGFLILMFVYPLNKKRTNELAVSLAEKRAKA